MSDPVDLSAIPGLMRSLRGDRPGARLQAAQALQELADTGSSAQRAAAQAGAMPVLMQPASSGSVEQRQAAGIALSSVLAEQRDLIAAFLAAGGLPLMARLLARGIPEEVQVAGASLAVWVVQNTCSWCAGAQTALARAGAIPAMEVLAWRLRHGDPALLQTVLEAVRNLAAGPRLCQAAVVAAGIVPTVVRMLSSGNGAVRAAAAGVISNVVVVNSVLLPDGFITLGLVESHLQAIAAAGAIPALVRCLQQPDPATETAAARALVCLAAGNPGRLRAIEAAGAVPPLQRVLQTSTDEDARDWARMALSAMCHPPAHTPLPAPAASHPFPATAPPSPGAPRTCAAPGCGATHGLRRCAGCAMVRYCSEACSCAHWKAHRAVCRRLQAEQQQQQSSAAAAEP